MSDPNDPPDDPLRYDRCGMMFLSALNEFPYWHDEMKTNHLLDPMHREGNIGKFLIKHLYGERVKLKVEVGLCGARNASWAINWSFVWSYTNAMGQLVQPISP